MFNLTNLRLHSFGLDISELSLKLIELKSTAQGWRLQAWGNISLPQGIINDGEIIDKPKFIAHLKKLLTISRGRLTTQYVVSCLPETKTFIKVIELSHPANNKKESLKEKNNIDKTIARELPNHIPFPPEEVIFDYRLLPSNDGKLKALVGAAPKRLSNDYIEILKEAKLEPVALEIEAQAIVRALTLKKEAFKLNLKRLAKYLNFKKKANQTNQSTKQIDKAVLIIDLGAVRTGIILYVSQTILFTVSIPLSGESITKTITAKTGLPYEKAEKAKRVCGLDPRKCKGELKIILNQSFKELIQEIRKVITFYQSHFSGYPAIDKIILSGGGAQMKKIDSLISEKTGIKTVKASPFNYISQPPGMVFDKRNSLSLTTALGLALRNS